MFSFNRWVRRGTSNTECHTWTHFASSLQWPESLDPQGAVFLLHCSVLLAEASGKTLPVRDLLEHMGSQSGFLDALLCWQFCSSENNPQGQDGGGQTRRGGVGGFIRRGSNTDLTWWGGGSERRRKSRGRAGHCDKGAFVTSNTLYCALFLLVQCFTDNVYPCRVPDSWQDDKSTKSKRDPLGLMYMI